MSVRGHFDTPSPVDQTVPPAVGAVEVAHGEYHNPILGADYSDPDVVRHQNDYYMVASSFNCTPGLPILHSKDLVHWQLINHAVKNLPGDRYQQVQHGCGVWAPAIRYHDKKFWIFFPMPDEGIFVTTADDPAGEWTEPHCLCPGRGLIDPCPLWDDDGDAYLVHAYANSRAGICHRLQVRPMAPDASRLYGKGQVVFENPAKHPILEGPKFLKRDGWYYILAPAGGVSTGWQVVLRSKDIYGPYEDRTVLAQGTTRINGPHQGALVDTPDEEWWFIHFQDAGPYGRITHLQPAAWQDGWPVIGVNQTTEGIGEPVASYRLPSAASKAPRSPIATSDYFESPTLGLQWQWNANHDPHWYSLTELPGVLRLFARPVQPNLIIDAPHLLTQKFPATEFSAQTLLSLPKNSGTTKAGFLVAGRAYAGLLVSRCDDLLTIEQFESGGLSSDETEEVNDTALLTSDHVLLRVTVSQEAKCAFSYSTDGVSYLPLGKPFAATPGMWIGARLGLISMGQDSHADFSFFQVQPLPEG